MVVRVVMVVRVAIVVRIEMVVYSHHAISYVRTPL